MEISWKLIAAAILFILSATPRAHAVVYWFVQDAGGAVLAADSVASGQNIFIAIDTIAGTSRRIWVFASNPTSEDVGRIYVSGTIASPQTIFLHVDDVSTPPTSMYPDTSHAGGRDWNGVSNSYNGAVVISGCVNGNLASGFSGNGGSSIIYADFIYIGGAIQNGFSAKAGEFRVRAGEGIASGAHITCETGNLTSVVVSSGSLLSNIKSLTGSIGLI